MREHKVTLELELPAARFWTLKRNTELDKHLANGDGQVFSMVEYVEGTDVTGDVTVQRLIKLAFQSNPVPKRLRSFLADSDFAFRNRAKWHKVLNRISLNE